MINIQHFRNAVVRPVLDGLGLRSAAAEELVMGTAAHESGLTYLKQVGGGPALGVCQMEPATHDDIWKNFLEYRPVLASDLRDMFGPAAGAAAHLVWNLAYAVAMCRIHYLRVKDPLPQVEDVDGLAAYWKAHYNTAAGAGTVEKWRADYDRIVKGS